MELASKMSSYSTLYSSTEIFKVKNIAVLGCVNESLTKKTYFPSLFEAK